MDNKGSGISEYKVSRVLIENMMGITIKNKVKRLSPYIIAGPKYILTLLTSSEIRAISLMAGTDSACKFHFSNQTQYAWTWQ